MITEFPERSVNFIKRNIHNCGKKARFSSAPYSTANFGICGISVPLTTRTVKQKDISIRSRRKKVEPEIKCTTRIYNGVKFHDKEHSTVPEVGIRVPSASKIYPGVRRTSIKQKEKFTKPEADPGSKETKTHRWHKSLKIECNQTREVLFLPVTNFPTSGHHEFPSQKFFQILGDSLPKTRSLLWEALDKRLQRGAGKSIERLLTAMEGKTKAETRAPHLTKSTNESSLSKDHNLNNNAELDSTFHSVYQTHLDTLSNVLAEDSNPEPVCISNSQELSKTKQKRKNPPKLEIKIAGDVSGQTLDMKIITAGLEEVSIAEELDNCGDLTPVITYNHVSTLNPLDKFATASPGGSNKGSRSPSPLLELPNLSGEKITKRPPE